MDGKEVPFFGEGDFDSKIEKYDEIDDNEDVFLTSAVAEFSYNTSLWYFARPNSKEQFEELKTNVNKLDEEDEEEEAK